MHEAPSAYAQPTQEPPLPDETVGEAFARLAQNGKAYAEAELERQKARAALIGAGTRDAAILVGIAMFIGSSTLTALLVGLVIALSPTLTPLGATAAVVIGALLVATLLLLLARSRIRRMMEAVRP